MNTTLDATLMPAQHTHGSSPTNGTHGEGVREVALFESRKARVVRTWDELSEIDRAVLLASVRQRRRLEQHKQAIYSQVYGIRSNR